MREDEREMRQSAEEFIVLTTQLRQEAERKLMNEKWLQIRRLRIKVARSETGLSAAERKLKGKRRQIRRLRRKLAGSGTELTAADHERELLLDEIDRLKFEIQRPRQVLEYGTSQSSQESD